MPGGRRAAGVAGPAPRLPSRAALNQQNSKSSLRPQAPLAGLGCPLHGLGISVSLADEHLQES